MIIKFKAISNKILLEHAKKLPLYGKIISHNDGFVFLDISNAFIHELYPLIREVNIEKPNYFSEGKTAGAHISIVYPDEKPRLPMKKMPNFISFSIRNICSTCLMRKKFFMLTVNCPKLTEIRYALGLSSFPVYKKNILPDFHITIATKNLVSVW